MKKIDMLRDIISDSLLRGEHDALIGLLDYLLNEKQIPAKRLEEFAASKLHIPTDFSHNFLRYFN